MEEHTIKVNIADRIYSQKVSVDNEAAIRKAARLVDGFIREYSREFPGISQIDIATIVALNAAMDNVALEEKLEKIGEQIEHMSADLERYVSPLK